VAAGGTLSSGYDFGSIMHYKCDAFQEDGAAKLSLEPNPGSGKTCDDVGQRDGLSERDVMGAYYLYRPEFEIVGASDGDVSDRFVLETAFSTKPVADEYIVWTVDGEERARGPRLSTLDLGLEPGTYSIAASIVIRSEELASRALSLTIANDAPVVSLGPDHEVDMNRVFTMTADVTDTEDGACPLSACSYAWDPAPHADLGGSAQYLFPTEGIVGITVTVTDGFGDTGSDDVVVTVVDSPPEPVITAPAAGSFSTGGSTTYSGSATDANHGPGPGDGELPCGSLTWSSSDPSDVLSVTNGCGGTITFGDPGARTLTLEADDGTGNTASTSVSVAVDGCEGGCAPDISFVFDTPPDLDGSQYDPSFTEPGYLLDTTIEMTASIADSDGPGTGIALEWWVNPPCLGSEGCSDFQIGGGTVFDPTTAFQSWTPSDDVAAWSNCVLVPLPYIIRLHATDGHGNTRVYSRTIYLACEFI
jgi:hypothetical protein